MTNTIEKANMDEMLEKMAETLEGYGKELREAAAALRGGADEDRALSGPVDIACYLSFDADELTERLGLDYVQQKSDAIVKVAGIAQVLHDLGKDGYSSPLGASQALQMSHALASAARTLDNYANRATLYGGAL